MLLVSVCVCVCVCVSERERERERERDNCVYLMCISYSLTYTGRPSVSCGTYKNKDNMQSSKYNLRER